MFSRLPQIVKTHRISLTMLLGTWAIFFGFVFLRGNVFYLDDLKIIYYPLEYEYAAAQNEWRLPEWSHLFGFGQPLMAWGQLGFFTPLHVLLRFLQLHPLILLQVSIASYFLLGLIGMYAYLQKQKLSQAASTLGAILFVFSGFSIGHLNHVNFYTSTMWLPYLLLTAHNLILSPTLKNTLLLTATATAITVSGQPQVILYTFIIGAIISLGQFVTNLPIKSWPKQLSPIAKTIGFTLLAGLLTIGLSAHSILPLYEFLPLTERNSPIPREQLLEFSYPPQHAITLILPYFFGDHASYWGAKSFQELAAFTGIIPLLLAGVSLLSWKSHRHLRQAALLLIIIAVLFALGQHSPLYKYLVENLYITTLNIPGRFVYFFTTGLLILAALGLNDLLNNRQKPFLKTVAALTLPSLLITPFLLQLDSPAIYTQFIKIINSPDPSWLLFLLGVAITLPLIWLHKRLAFTSWLLPLMTSVTLLIVSIPYNPTTHATDAFTDSTFTTHLRAYHDQTGLPARLYAREDIRIGGLQSGQLPTHSEYIAPHFTIIQPITLPLSDDCLIVPMSATPGNGHQITISLHTAPLSLPLASTIRTESDIFHEPNQTICFDELKNQEHPLFLQFASTQATTIRLQTTPLPTNDPKNQAYFLRVPDPTPEQIQASQKPFIITYRTYADTAFDLENFLLARHLNVTASSSSARWIGALSIRPYREFIEKFFANDQDQPIDGDGLHALARHRRLVDMAGITHFATTLDQASAANDPFLRQNYQLVAEQPLEGTVLRLYRNPQAYPKAYLVPKAQFKPAADETRTALLNTTYNPQELVYINGPTPPQNLPQSSFPLTYTAQITTYSPIDTTVDVSTDQEAILVVTDTSTPEWQTYLDGNLAPQYTANSFFKAAIVPAGHHTVSFRYESPAMQRSNRLSQGALLIMLVLTGLHFYLNRPSHARTIS